MKLIDMLVEDGLNGWQWPDGVECITQDNGSSICKGVAFGYHKTPYLKKNIWLANNGTGHADAKIKKYDVVADDWATAIITREQYEAALAAKNDGWIEWGGGECPVDTKTLVDIRLKVGFTYKSCHPGDYSWRHAGGGGDIIAYRLHKPQEVTKADDEADLNECIGQDAAPVWSGEGLPPAGCECECQFRGEWQKCTILFSGKQIVVVMVGDDGYPFESKGSLFRPIRSEAERKRDDICDKIYGAMTNAKRKDNRSDMAEEIYDAIAAGKIPGLRLGD